MSLRIITVSQRALNSWKFNGGNTSGLRIEASTPDDNLAAFTIHMVDEPVSLTDALIGLQVDAERTVIVFMPPLGGHDFSGEVCSRIRRQYPGAAIFFEVEDAAEWLEGQVAAKQSEVSAAVV